MFSVPIEPGRDVDLDREDRERLGKRLVELASDLEAQHSPFIRNIEVWWEWYEGRPAVTERNDPWQGASNIIIPVIQYTADALKARCQNTVFATAPDVIISRTKNPLLRDIARDTAEFFNWAADDNEFDLRTPSISYIDEMVIVGRATLYQKWASRQRYVLSPSTGKPTLVNLGSGPIYEHIPAEALLWPVAHPLSDSEVVIRQATKTRSELILMRSLGQIPALNDEEFEKLLNQETDHGYTENIARNRARAAGLTHDPRFSPYDIREAWVDWPMLKGAVEDPTSSDPKSRSLPLVVTFERNSGAILRILTKPFLVRGVPFYEGHFRTATGHRSAGGIAKRLEHIQRAASTIVNQSIDVVTLANSVPFLTSDIDFANKRLSLGRPLYVNDINATREVNLSKVIAPDLSLLNILFVIGERISGINDPLLGRETRMGGHPSPASSTAMLLQESREMLKATLNNLRFQYGRAAEDTISLYQQFEVGDAGRIIRAMGPARAENLKQFLFPEGPIAGQLSFDLKAVSETLNQEQEFQQAVATTQVVMNYYSNIMAVATAVDRKQLGPFGMQVASDMLQALTKSGIRTLEAARLEDPKEFFLKLKESNGDPRVIQEFGDLASSRLQELAASTGQSRLPIIPSVPGSVQMAASRGNGPSGF